MPCRSRSGRDGHADELLAFATSYDLILCVGNEKKGIPFSSVCLGASGASDIVRARVETFVVLV